MCYNNAYVIHCELYKIICMAHMHIIGGADNVIAEEAVLGGSEKKLGDTSLEGMLKAGNLAVHLLPYSSIKGDLHKL